MRKENFTLVEIIVVMVIIMILTGLTISILRSISRRNFNVYVKGQLEKLDIALDSYKQDWGYYPQSNAPSTLKNVLNNHFVSPSLVPYLENIENSYTDMNDVPYFYIYPGIINTTSYDLWSLGYDEKAGKIEDPILGVKWNGNNETAIRQATQEDKDVSGDGFGIPDHLDSKYDDICNWERL